MNGKTYLRAMGIVVLALLLLAPAARAASWLSVLRWSSPRESLAEEAGGLLALWHRLTVIFAADDGDNRGTIDPNG